MSQQNFLKQLDKTLFWDTKIDSLDIKKYSDFIIGRVLSFGDIRDYHILQKMYNFQKIKKAGIKANYSNKKTINFWSIIFDVPINKFLCIKKLFMPKPNAFWKR